MVRLIYPMKVYYFLHKNKPSIAQTESFRLPIGIPSVIKAVVLEAPTVWKLFMAQYMAKLVKVVIWAHFLSLVSFPLLVV